MERSLAGTSSTRDEEKKLSVGMRGELARALGSRGQERLQAILESSAPEALTRALAPVEVFYTYSELDDEGQRSLVRLLSGVQVDYLLDLDLWQKDRLDPVKALLWLERLFLSDPEQAVGWMLRADTELVVLVLQHLVVVTEGPTGSDVALVEAQDSLPPFSAEGIYYIHFKFPPAAKLLKELFIRVAGEDMENYLALLQDMNNLTSSQAEEAAHEQRWRRLKDEGFLPPEDAYEVYSWPGCDEGEPLAEIEDAEVTSPAVGEEPAPTALALAGPTGLLAAAVDGLSDDEKAEVSWSLVVTGAHILSADHLPFGDLEAHRAALRKSLGYVNVGLEDGAGSDTSRARELLVQKGTRHLFRSGFSVVAALGRRATELKRQSWLESQIGLGLELLDEPMEEVIRGLASPRPLFPARALSAEGSDRDFRSLDEVHQCAELLGRAEALRRLFIDGLGLDLAPTEVFDLTDCEPPEHNAMSLGLILRTAMANLVVGDQLRYAPVLSSQLPALVSGLGRATDGALEESGLRQRVFDALIERLESPTEGELGHINEFLVNNLGELYSALGGLRADEAIDPRFVGAIVVKHVRG